MSLTPGTTPETQSPAPVQNQAVSTTQSPAAVAPERRAAPPNSGAPKASDAGKQDFYWRRQAEKLEKELAALRSAEAVELNRLRAERADLEARAQSAEAKHNRLQLLVDSGLPKELAELVPEGNPEEVAAFVEKLKPVAEKLARPAPAGTLTNPPNRASSDSARLEQLAAAAARGDKSALREYAALREKVRGTK